MRILRGLRRLIAEIVAASPQKAAASVALMIALSFTEGVGLLLLMPLLGLVGIDQSTSMPQVATWFEAVFAAIGVTPTLGAGLVAFVIVAGARAVLLRSQASMNMAVQEDVTAGMRGRLYRAIAGAEWRFLVTRQSSQFVHLLAGEIGRVGGAALQVIDLAVITAVSLVYLGLAVHLSLGMASLVLACALGIAFTARGRLDRARALGARAAAARSRLHVAIAEHVGSMKTAKSYGATDRHVDVFMRLSHELREISLEVTAGEGDFQQSIEFGSTALLAFIVYVAYEIIGVTASQLLVVLFIFGRLMPRLMTVYRRLQSISGAMPVIEAIDRTERECLEAAEPKWPGSDVLTLSKSIRLENVSFSYLRRPDPALVDLNLEITAGLTTAIVGSSGSGKSTLSDLLIGLLTPSSGRIVIDGNPLTPDRWTGWRQHISYVPQDTFLFHDTVRANLTWARPSANDNDLWHALHLAAADEFVASLPSGLDTMIGERGVLVSGGERQRLSLARAILRRPRILVLDEATSSLDSETEGRIQQAIESLHHEVTIVVVTHRLSMISGADVIHVLDGGRLVESGTWEELLARPNGRFVELCRAQGIYRRPAVVETETARDTIEVVEVAVSRR